MVTGILQSCLIQPVNSLVKILIIFLGFGTKVCAYRMSMSKWGSSSALTGFKGNKGNLQVKAQSNVFGCLKASSTAENPSSNQQFGAQKP